MPKLSIIIPIYNTEKYIKKCLDSLAKQTMQDFQVILVNDGSTDNSKQIIQEYTKNKILKNIVYLEKENGGLSDARNYGVTYATGKYITFLDSDDYIDKNLYKQLEKYMDKNIDLIKFKMKTVDENENIIENLNGPIFEKCTGEEAFGKLVTKDCFLEVACIYLYKKSFFQEHNFKYIKGVYHEDFGLTPLILVQANSVVSTNIYGYYYLQTSNSIMRNKDYETNKKKVYDVLKQYDNAIKQIEECKISKKTRELIKRYYTNTTILKAKELKEQDLNKYILELKKRKIYKNIKPYNLKQLIKQIILKVNVKLYIKMLQFTDQK